MNSNKTGSLGRKALFTAAKAREILEARKMFVGSRLTTTQFIEQLVLAGDLAEPCSLATMQRLLSGRMFPALRELHPDGSENEEKYYDYTAVPRSPRGQPPKEARIDKDTGNLIPIFTKRQKQLRDTIVHDAEMRSITVASQAARQELSNSLDAARRASFLAEQLEAKVASLEARVKALEPAK